LLKKGFSSLFLGVISNSIQQEPLYDSFCVASALLGYQTVTRLVDSLESVYICSR